MIEDNLDVLALLMKDQQKQQGIFKPGVYWKPYTDRINYYIRKDGLAAFRAHEGIGKGYADTVTKDPFVSLPLKSKTYMLYRLVRLMPMVDRYIFNTYRKIIATYLRQLTELQATLLIEQNRDLLRKYQPALKNIDTVAGASQQYVEWEGHKIAFSYIEALRRLANLADSVDFSEKKSFMEVGGGFGANTHLMLTMFPNIKTCIYVDLPPMLHVATEHLRHHFGDRLMDYAEFKTQQEAGKLDIEGRLVCVPPWALENLSHEIDLFWNSCSFQEMDDDQISWYGRWIAANALQGGADILALFYPADSYERSEKRSLDLLAREGLMFQKLSLPASGDNLTYAIVKLRKSSERQSRAVASGG